MFPQWGFLEYVKMNITMIIKGDRYIEKVLYGFSIFIAIVYTPYLKTISKNTCILTYHVSGIILYRTDQIIEVLHI